MNPFVTQIKNLGPARLAAMAGVAVDLIAFIIFFATRFSTPPMELLYSNLSATDSREITQQLELKAIPFTIANNGAEIMVPSERERRRERLSLAPRVARSHHRTQDPQLARQRA